MIHVFYPQSFWGNGPRETCYNICSHWPQQGQDVRVHTAASLRPDPAGIMAPALPAVLPAQLRCWLAGQTGLNGWLEARSLSQGLAAISSGDWCYAWPGTPIGILKDIKARGGRLVLEFINCHTAYAKKILDAECDRVAAPKYTHLTPQALAYDTERTALADAVFAPGPFVGPSIEATSKTVPQILQVAYGANVPSGPLPLRKSDPGHPLRYLFVGTLAPRKGVHVLLEAWKIANLPAELWLAGGGAEPWIEAHYLKSLPENVKRLGHCSDIAQVYAETDVFVFPSLEEGGPQVCYEAAAHGLPLVVTPMGGGRIAVQDHTALMVPPSDADALAGALVRMHTDAEMRFKLGREANRQFQHFNWHAIADQRRAALLAL